MFIVYGIYRWSKKRVAFRNDYCLQCRSETMAEQIRAFEVGHIFWIPLLPAGFWKHWYCVVCHHDPHRFPGTHRSFKWIGIAMLLLFAVVFWSFPPEPNDVAITWVFRIGAPIAALLVFLNIRKTGPDVSLKEKLAHVFPAAQIVCPFCGTDLMVGNQTSCPKCGVVRL